MIVEISPEPSPAERAAIEAALRALAERDGAGRGAWWQAGLAENLADDQSPSEALWAAPEAPSTASRGSR